MVRIWCLPITTLDRQHLLGEHAELHAIFNAILKLRKGVKAGWQHHPQTLRFVNHLGMLVSRHREQVDEMAVRGYVHKSPLVLNDALGLADFDVSEPYVYSDLEMQADLNILERKMEA